MISYSLKDNEYTAGCYVRAFKIKLMSLKSKHDVKGSLYDVGLQDYTVMCALPHCLCALAGSESHLKALAELIGLAQIDTGRSRGHW